MARSGVGVAALGERDQAGRVVTERSTYADNLLIELDGIAASYAEVLADSGIRYVNPNRYDGGLVFVGAADWGWADSNDALEAARMTLLRRLREWTPRFRLLFPHPTLEVAKRLDDGIAHLERLAHSRPLGPFDSPNNRRSAR